MSDDLQAELQTYAQHLPELIGSIGKFVLIKGTELIGKFDTYDDALRAGYAKFGLERFLVKQIAPPGQSAYFSRDLAGIGD